MKKNLNDPEEDGLDALINNRAARQYATRGSHVLFFNVYFKHYIKHPMPEFHRDIFRVTEDSQNTLAMIVAFRGSGKSTLVTFSYSMWSILGVQQKKFVLIICQTQAQARQQMTNIKDELENNKILRDDLGPFRQESGTEQWAMSSLVFGNTGARIMVASVDQSIRGIRHHQYRPDLIILDDIEDMNSTKTMEGRSKAFDWFTREIVPLGDIGTRIIMVGNLLHEDSLVMRLKRMIDSEDIKGTYHWFPLLDANGACLWPEKFNTEEKIDDLRRSVANELAWRQEYLLEIVSDSTRVIYPEWIKTYSEFPKGKQKARVIIVGVDLAIKETKRSDYTAMVAMKVYGYGEDAVAYVLSNPVHGRMQFPDVVESARNLNATLKPLSELDPSFMVESNGFQEIYVNAFAEAGCDVQGIKVVTDKRSRIALTSYHIRAGKILFPEKGAEDLITELTGFGNENHDDLADAFSLGATEFIRILSEAVPSITFFDVGGGRPSRGGMSDYDDDDDGIEIDSSFLWGR